jgi:two-component system, NtrC family, response regulator GlrR
MSTEALHAAITGQLNHFVLEVTDGADKGKRVDIVQPVTVGTHPDAGLRMTDGSISRQHFTCRVTSAGVMVSDDGSTNGLFLAGTRVSQFVARNTTHFRAGRSTFRLLRERHVPNETLEYFGDALAVSQSMKRVFVALKQAAKANAAVLLLGETGTGKEVLARAVHSFSPRKDKPFVVVDCAALHVETADSALFGHAKGSFTGAASARVGLLAQANCGTVFFDEIGELPAELQARLLRFLQEGQVRAVGSNVTQRLDIRVISATHRDLSAMVDKNQFRADLFYRLSALTVQLPSLRERPEDVEPLVRQALTNRGQGDFEVSAELLAHLLAHHWPGNVRELINAVDTVLLQPESAPAVPTKDSGAPDFHNAKEVLLEAFSRQYFEALYLKAKGNVSEVARLSKVNRTWVHQLLTRMGIHTKG